MHIALLEAQCEKLGIFKAPPFISLEDNWYDN
jgi:hypothetical protein